MDDDHDLLDAALALTDGFAVDWAEQATRLTSDEQRVLARLREISAVAGFHGPADDRLGSLHDTIRDPRAAGDAAPLRWGALDILEKLGRGSYGDVYRARDPRLGRDVALKLLRGAAMGSDASQGLVKEAHLLSRVRHPNVVTVHGAADAAGRTGIWMELIEGETLLDKVHRTGPFPAAEIDRVGRDLCHAVAAVHQAGLLHRDIKAQNVMLACDGRVVLMDFGTGGESAESTPRGTPLYLAPEVLAGAPPTQRSEVYSVGVLLWFLATASFPVTGETLKEISARHAHGGRTTNLRRIRPDLPKRLASIIDSCIDEDPARRFAGAAELRAALEGLATRGARLKQLGAAAMLAVAVAVSGYATWRSTSPSSPARIAFEAGDLILRVPFENQTGDTSLDGLIDAALQRELSESSSIRIASGARIADALRLMHQPADAPIDVPVAMGISQRDKGIRVIQSGRIERTGGTLVITATLIDPWTGQALSEISEPATGSADAARAVRRLAERLRASLGESAEAIRQSARQLESVTTPSLEALRAYSESYRLGTTAEPRSWDTAMVLVQRALSLDPEFPAARIWYAVCLSNLKAPVDGYRSAARAALEVVHQASPWEQHWVRAMYHLLHEELRAAAAEFEQLLALRPDHEEGAARLQFTYSRLRLHSDAARIATARANARPNDLGLNSQAIQALGAEGGFEGARPLIERMESLIGETDGGSPANAAALATLRGWHALKQRDANQAVMLLEPAGRRFDDWSPGARDYLAMQLHQVYSAMGRAADARRYAASIRFANVRQIMLATVSRLTGEKTRARQELRWVSLAVLIEEPNQLVARMTRPQANAAVSHMIWAGLLEKAEQELEYLDPVQRDPRSAGIAPTVVPEAALHGELWLARGDMDRAAPLLEKAWAEGAGQAVPRARTADALTDILLKKGDPARAASILREALRALDSGLQPRYMVSMPLQLKLATVLRAMGDVAAAREVEGDLRLLLSAADPDFPILVELGRR